MVTKCPVRTGSAMTRLQRRTYITVAGSERPIFEVLSKEPVLLLSICCFGDGNGINFPIR